MRGSVIDFFHKGASMTKKVTGKARMVDMKSLPDIRSKPFHKITRIGTFENGDGPVVSVLLEVADSPEARGKGLMGRTEKDFPAICGMLFEGLSGGGYFWMKNCLIPLDIAFLSKEGRVTKMYTMPVDKNGEQHYEYGPDDVAAVETNGGFLKKWGISREFKFVTKQLKEVGNG